MAEPTATAGGVSLTVLFIAVLGPMAGPYALIVAAAIAGALWPLSAAETTRRAALWLLFRCALTAVVLTVFLASVLDRLIGFPVSDSLAPVALAIGALGNGWQPVFSALGDALRGFIRRKGEGNGN